MSIDLLSPPAGDVGRLVRRGISWWLAELAELLPGRLTSFFGRDEWSARVEPGPNGTLIWSSPPARQSAIGHGGAVAIGLDRALIFESVVELPLAAEGTLRQILQHQINRLVPLEPAETAFQYRIEPRAADAKTLKVQVYIAKRATIERALAMARDVGLDPKRVILADAQREGSLPALWQADDAVGSQRAWRRRLEITALILAAAGYALYVHRLDRMRDGLAARLATATPAAAAVRALGSEVERIDTAAAFFARRRRDTEALGVVDLLTRTVPLDSWLTGLSIRGREVEIAGYSPHASDLVARVEASEIFRNPQFRSPITLAPDGKSERFDLTFEIRPGAAR